MRLITNALDQIAIISNYSQQPQLDPLDQCRYAHFQSHQVLPAHVYILSSPHPLIPQGARPKTHLFLCACML